MSIVNSISNSFSFLWSLSSVCRSCQAFYVDKMNRQDQYNYKTRIQEVVPSTRFGQALASLFYLKRHKKQDEQGRAPVVSNLRSQSRTQTISSPSCYTMPFEVLTPMKRSETPSPPPN